ncbi:MAG: hypothetical protein GY822_16255, partial [Deltaproteobacteria bacterium]|nr:hypothetical protein [Deltaproteobacteria bacterium]
MPFQVGDFRIPTIGDAVQSGEAMLGNVVEGIIEGISGQRVELTPGVGVDNTTAEGTKGKGDIKFKDKMASHDEVERLRRELEKELNAVRTELAKQKLKAVTSQTKPAPSQIRPTFQPPQQNQGMNPMMMLMLARRDDEQMDPLLMMLLMQSMGSPSIGSVNGQQLQMDPMAFATMQMFASAINP